MHHAGPQADGRAGSQQVTSFSLTDVCFTLFLSFSFTGISVKNEQMWLKKVTGRNLYFLFFLNFCCLNVLHWIFHLKHFNTDSWCCIFCRSQRLQFDVSSPNGILLFRETSKMITTYGTLISIRTFIINFILYSETLWPSSYGDQKGSEIQKQTEYIFSCL